MPETDNAPPAVIDKPLLTEIAPKADVVAAGKSVAGINAATEVI